jgi:Fe-S cluster assembly protein SufD
VFNTAVCVHPGADGSEARQSNANILLSRRAEIDTKPELEIYADEVVASHGATVGQLDELAVFYLRSRGLSEQEARQLLTTAFCQSVSDKLADKVLGEVISQRMMDVMPQAE